MLNSVNIYGILTEDPAIHYTQKGTACSTLSVVINEKIKIGNELKNMPTYVRVSVWAKIAENCQKYLKKGSKIIVTGKLQNKTWEEADTGKKRVSLEVLASEVIFVSNKTQETTEES